MSAVCPSARNRRSFTLVELVVVVLLLGILAAVASSRMMRVRDDAEVAVIQQSLRLIQEQIDLYYARNGTYPPTIEAKWFRGNRLPRHPQNDGSIPDLHVFTADDRVHPMYKIVDRYGAYWYNPNVGIVRARVRYQGTDEATLAYYNRVHGSALTQLDQRYD